MSAFSSVNGVSIRCLHHNNLLSVAVAISINHFYLSTAEEAIVQEYLRSQDYFASTCIRAICPPTAIGASENDAKSLKSTTVHPTNKDEGCESVCRPQLHLYYRYFKYSSHYFVNSLYVGFQRVRLYIVLQFGVLPKVWKLS